MGRRNVFGYGNTCFIWYSEYHGCKESRNCAIHSAGLLVVSIFTLTIATLCSGKASIHNMNPLWGFDKSGATVAWNNGTFKNISQFAHSGQLGIASSILATFAIALWAFVGFDTIPQAAEEFKFSYKKVSIIMVVTILFGCFVYTANNTIAATVLSNWPELIVESKFTPWLLLAALYYQVSWDFIWHQVG